MTFPPRKAANKNSVVFWTDEHVKIVIMSFCSGYKESHK